jgi:hypothetical protein
MAAKIRRRFITTWEIVRNCGKIILKNRREHRRSQEQPPARGCCGPIFSPFSRMPSLEIQISGLEPSCLVHSCSEMSSPARWDWSLLGCRTRVTGADLPLTSVNCGVLSGQTFTMRALLLSFTTAQTNTAASDLRNRPTFKTA